MDLQEGSSKELNLPENFPYGWHSSAKRRDEEKEDDYDKSRNPFQLNDSTSNTHVFVSTAFTRIGFEHTNEYGMTMKELVQ
jgi:hypothetical protein